MPGGVDAAIRAASARRLRSAPCGPWKRSTEKRRFGRSNPRIRITGSRSPSRTTILSRTGGAAVAVSASTGGAPQRLDRRPQPQVLGPEVMAPLGHAVRLVDHEQREVRDRELIQDIGPG